jgi:ABC-type glycerol-3-phosphate transport system permease component
MATTPLTSSGATGGSGRADQPPARMRLTGIRLRKKSYVWALFCIMIIVAVIMLYPFWYMIDNAFRNANQFDVQSGHSLAGWHELFANLPVFSQMLNSTLVCAAAIAIILVVSTTAGWSSCWWSPR